MAALSSVADGDDILATQYDDVVNELNGPWSAWTPSLHAASANPFIGAGGTATGFYKEIGSAVVHGWGQVTFGPSSISNGTGIYYVPLPVTPSSNYDSEAAIVGAATLYDSSGTTFYVGVAAIIEGNLRITITGSSGSMTDADPISISFNDSIRFNFAYEPA